MSQISKIDTPEPLNGIFNALDISVQTYAHAPCFTCADGVEIKKELIGGHTKNLFLKDKKGVLWLVVALEDTVIDLKWLPKRINSARLSFGKAELLYEILQVEPGHVTPFSLIHDKDQVINLILDARMMVHELLYYHPLKNDKTTAISPENLVKFVKHHGYEPQIIEFE